ncbi:uncharacterized protein LAESUDRAFT_654759 [Laetiporus sulphureus 93-53]|uniref:Integral membrane protein n=1 Tax=Laetiporus sulphureus 93-53 TaxID=1314785 RepID=A0A165DZV7_9APHY|nr:uncharacterized protein LAESUDRAFT_654759 [Laetiporus sulphureus 93-53]KZT05976.1 hypothetical protein LAESUDRAFT_654759 [Laetiporus sulphureus 93-53]
MSTVAAPKKINPLLAAYLASLAAHPLRTKAITTSVLQFGQEVLATHFAGVPAQQVPKDAPLYARLLALTKINAKAPKMALYGFFVSAPLSHTMVGQMQRLFAGKTSLSAKIGQVLVSNLVVAPIQVLVYLSCTSVINGARSVDEVVKTIRAGFMSALRVTWMTLPLTIVFAQRYLSPELWVPFINLVQFITGTYFNMKLKKIRMAMEAKAKRDQEEKRE